MTKLCLISDTHTQHRKLVIPECDILIHAGDISDRGELPQVYDFINWFNDQPAKYKVFTSGNHDFSFQDKHRKNKIREALIQHPSIIYLEDEYTVIEGIKIYGSPWTPWFYNWAFNAMPGSELTKIWSKIPEDVDILITHGPPYGYGDYIPETRERVGCKQLIQRLLEVKPKIHIFGHIHSGFGMYTLRIPPKEGEIAFEHQTTCINASVLDNDYYLCNDPVVIEYEDFI